MLDVPIQYRVLRFDDLIRHFWKHDSCHEIICCCVPPTSKALKFIRKALQCNPRDTSQAHPFFSVLVEMEEKLIKVLMVPAT